VSSASCAPAGSSFKTKGFGAADVWRANSSRVTLETTTTNCHCRPPAREIIVPLKAASQAAWHRLRIVTTNPSLGFSSGRSSRRLPFGRQCYAWLQGATPMNPLVSASRQERRASPELHPPHLRERKGDWRPKMPFAGPFSKPCAIFGASFVRVARNPTEGGTSVKTLGDFRRGVRPWLVRRGISTSRASLKWP
jgi:hypothetical protein